MPWTEPGILGTVQSAIYNAMSTNISFQFQHPFPQISIIVLQSIQATNFQFPYYMVLKMSIIGALSHDDEWW